MVQPLNYLKETPSQTAGPYVHIGLIPAQAGFEIFEKNFSNSLITPETQGERIAIEGRVLDGSGTPLRDVLLEIWQADSHGRYWQPGTGGAGAFHGWGRTGADFQTGTYRFETVKPGGAMGRHGRPMAPHVSFWIVARGINIGLYTGMYFADEAAANANDPVLNLIEHEVRRETLLTARSTRGGSAVYTFDIRLQGEGETVFFDV